MPTCRTCGEASRDGARYCATCGAPLAAEPADPGSADPFLGQTLEGRYLVQRKIGRGGMGAVYKAVHTQLDVPVAVKIVKRELLSHPAMVHRFEREARAASRLRHPNIVAVTDFGQAADGTLFMVMEYVSGPTLARVIADEAPLPERRVVDVGAQVLSALAEAHARHVLHRDLKPENVILQPRRDGPEAVKVLDFGIAKMLAGTDAASTLTQAGLVCGTPGYMSPEQLRGVDVDARSDLFSVGVVLYEMLTHQLPFGVATPMELLRRHVSAPTPALGGRADPGGLAALVMRALSPEREERPPSATEMRDLLLAARPRRPRPEHRSRPGTTGGRPASGATLARSARAPATPLAGTPVSRAGKTPAATPVGRTAKTPLGSLDQSVLERACRDLAAHIGPLARVIVRRASAQARDARDLYELVAREIPNDDDRARFLRLAPQGR